MRHFPDPDLGRPNLHSAPGYLLWLVARHRGSVLLATFHGVLCSLAMALVPAAVGRGIDQGLLARDQRSLLLCGAVVLGLGVTQAVTGTLRDRCALTNRLGASYRTMQLVTRKASDLGVELPRKISSGAVVSVGATDVTRIGIALESTARGSGAVVSIVAVAGLMLATSWQLGLVALGGVPLIVWGIARLLRLLHSRQQDLREQQGALADLSVDIVDGLRVLRGIGGEAVFGARYRERSQAVRREGVRIATVEAGVVAARLLLPGLLTTVIVWLGAHYVSTGRLSPGELIAFYGYAVFLADQLRRVTATADQLTRAAVGAGRIIDFLKLPRDLRSGDTGADSLGAAELHDPATELTLRPGRFTAVVCGTTAEAQALADRLGRCIATGDDGAVETEPTYGRIPLSAYPLDALRRHILVVDDSSRLFSGELRGELDPTGRADQQTLDAAIEAASARDILDALPDGLAQQIAGGRDFSGGQHQRLALVRALLADPELLLLVEPTSALDAHTEGRIAERLRAHRRGRSTAVFTTSPILLDAAEHVVYVHGDRVVAEGPHSALLADPRYRAVVTREVAVA